VSIVTPTAEEELVAELELLGVNYLSRQTTCRARKVRPAHQLLADLVRQPSARVRAAVISVLLARPDLAEAVPTALDRLTDAERLTLQYFYTAAVLLQQLYATQLNALALSPLTPLPDLFSVTLGAPPTGDPQMRLRRLADAQRRATGATVNWAGTYEHTARQLLRRWASEQRWRQ
jgi:DNA-binding TFAR19-related protein (PDSD5 family)